MFDDIPIAEYHGRIGSIKNATIRYRDLTGIRFGKLVANRRVQSPWKISRTYHVWLCRCDCGGERCVDSGVLIKGLVHSCGCTRKDRKKHCPVMIAVVIDHRQSTRKSTAKIGEYFGLTKNSVIGILARAGMSADANLWVEPEGEAEISEAENSVPKHPLIPDFPPHSRCCFPQGTPGEAVFSWCGERVKTGSSYCAGHHSIVYVDERELARRKKAAETGQKKAA